HNVNVSTLSKYSCNASFNKALLHIKVIYFQDQSGSSAAENHQGNTNNFASFNNPAKIFVE
ncbi:MAG: hypothetical protein ACOZBL_00510, partial [Patescibacteria group bacterium]